MNSSLNHDKQDCSDREPDDRSLLILFATETGTAQDVADRIARECRRIHFKCKVSSMHAYPLASVPRFLSIRCMFKHPFIVRTDFWKQSHFCSVYNRLRFRASFDDATLAATPSLRPAFGFIRRSCICKLWVRGHVLREILLAKQTACQKVGESWRHRNMQ
jgi:hypothetical protein